MIQHNPESHGVIFLFGPTSTGKSHFVRQMEKQLCGEYKILNSCMTEFLEVVLDDVRHNTESFSMTELCDRYKDIDLFILEDTHEIKERLSTQIFLSDLFAELNKRKKKVLLVGTGTIKDISELYEQLCVKIGEDCMQIEWKLMEA